MDNIHNNSCRARPWHRRLRGIDTQAAPEQRLEARRSGIPLRDSVRGYKADRPVSTDKFRCLTKEVGGQIRGSVSAFEGTQEPWNIERVVTRDNGVATGERRI